MGMLLEFRNECACTAVAQRAPWMREADLVVAPCVGWEGNPLAAQIELGSTLVAVDGVHVAGADVGNVAEMMAAGAERVRVLTLVRPPPLTQRLGAEALASAEHVPPTFSPGEFAVVVGQSGATGASVVPGTSSAEATADAGDIARERGDVQGAILHYSRALALCPTVEGQLDLLLDRAEVQLLEGVTMQPLEEVEARPSEALKDCEMALQIAHDMNLDSIAAGQGAQPLETRAHIARAKALTMLARYQEARDDVTLCMEHMVEPEEQVRGDSPAAVADCPPPPSVSSTNSQPLSPLKRWKSLTGQHAGALGAHRAPHHE